MKTIVRAKGGSKERVVEVRDIKVPDLWKVVHNHELDIPAKYKAQILETWHLAHDLLRVIKETP